MKPRFNPVEVLIFLGVAFLFGGSVYQLFHDSGTSDRAVASEPSDRAPSSTGRAIEQLELGCEAPKEPIRTKAESLNLQGKLCSKKHLSAKRLTVRNRNAQGQVDATVFLDTATAHFTTELLKLSPGTNFITIEAASGHIAELQIIRE